MSSIEGEEGARGRLELTVAALSVAWNAWLPRAARRRAAQGPAMAAMAPDRFGCIASFEAPLSPRFKRIFVYLYDFADISGFVEHHLSPR